MKSPSYARLASRQASIGSVELTPLKVISSGRMKRARLVTMYEKPDHFSRMLFAPRFWRARKMRIERTGFARQIRFYSRVVDAVVRPARAGPCAGRHDSKRLHHEVGDHRQRGLQRE